MAKGLEVSGDLAHIFAQLGNFGAWGVLVGYLIYREQADRKERREVIERDIASREKLATSLTALSMVISGRSSV